MSRTLIRRLQIHIFFITAALLTTLSMPPAVFAGDDAPSAETCSALGTITVKCFYCPSDQYMGDVTVEAKYNPRTKSCLEEEWDAILLCDTYYITGWNRTSIRYRYTIGARTYTGEGPENCTKTTPYQ